ncbi:hypothetical protein B0H14DRAFT_3660125 [Mycena olivaceomarginata]|nr:hypothetical protein B0H14DRAFT_3660125 [Mycena olivaceomarginata]
MCSSSRTTCRCTRRPSDRAKSCAAILGRIRPTRWIPTSTTRLGARGQSATKTPENIEEDVDDERKWTAEEDLTVAHVWIEGGDISRGVVYPRRGKGNLPYVFSACGLVYLEDPTEEDDLEAEDRTAQLDPETWNEPENAFAKYYRQHTLLPFAFTEEAAASSSASASVSAARFSSSPTRPSPSSFYSSPSRDLSSRPAPAAPVPAPSTRPPGRDLPETHPRPAPLAAQAHPPPPAPHRHPHARAARQRPPERPRKKRKLLPVPRKGSMVSRATRMTMMIATARVFRGAVMFKQQFQKDCVDGWIFYFHDAS